MNWPDGSSKGNRLKKGFARCWLFSGDITPALIPMFLQNRLHTKAKGVLKTIQGYPETVFVQGFQGMPLFQPVFCFLFQS